MNIFEKSLLFILVISFIIGISSLIRIANSDDSVEIRNKKIEAYIFLSIPVLIMIYFGYRSYIINCNKESEIIWNFRTLKEDYDYTF